MARWGAAFKAAVAQLDVVRPQDHEYASTVGDAPWVRETPTGWQRLAAAGFVQVRHARACSVLSALVHADTTLAPRRPPVVWWPPSGWYVHAWANLVVVAFGEAVWRSVTQEPCAYRAGLVSMLDYVWGEGDAGAVFALGGEPALFDFVARARPRWEEAWRPGYWDVSMPGWRTNWT